MLGRLASFVQQAAEVLAPTATLQEDFIHHWKAVTHHLVDQKDERLPVQSTNVPDHLANMVELLCKEESEGDGTAVTGPCMEYLLQHKILETLHTLGRADCPPGMKLQVLKFFTSVIGHAQQPLLPNIHVHKPVLRLIHCCADSRASPTESDEVLFLCTVAGKLKQLPHLASVFLEQRPTSTSAEATSAASTKSPRRDRATLAAEADHSKFHLLATLLELSKSEDRNVSRKACEGMLLCASLDNENTARSIANNSPFCQILADRVQSTFAAIPLDLPAQKVLACSARWGMEGGTDDEDAYDGRLELRAWLSCVDYFDQLVLASHPVVAAAMQESLRERFFRTQLETRLSQMSEHGLVVTTALLTKLVEVLRAPPLVHSLVRLLVGASATSESSADQVELCQHLISRCDHVNEELSLVSLQLFDLLLQKNDPVVIHRLVLRYLTGDRHLKPSARGKGHTRFAVAAAAAAAAAAPAVPSTANADSGTSSGNANGSAVPDKPATPSERSSSEPPSPVAVSISPPSSPQVGILNVTQTLIPAADAASPALPHANGDADSNPSSRLPSASELPSLPVSPAATPGTPGTPTTPSLSFIQSPQVLAASTPSAVGPTAASTVGKEALAASMEIEPLVQQLFAERNHAELIINTFLTMLPEAAKTSLQMPSSGYDEYVCDAQAQVSQCFAAVQKWEAVDSTEQAAQQEVFSEGPFLRLLFNKLQRVLDQPYEINLTVTGLLTRLAYFPHRNLHAYLMDPFVPLDDNVRSLTTVLRQISAELTLRAQRTPTFQGSVIAARKRLCGASSTLADAASIHKDHLAEAVVVLEEFTKELAAVVFVKSAAYLQQCDIP